MKKDQNHPLRAGWLSRSDDNVESARLFQVQISLLPRTPREVCDTLNLNWWAAAKLHQDGWLSFDPHTLTQLEENQEAELLLVGSLVAAGCDSAMLERLLHGLRKPYHYRPGRIYLDWFTGQWRLIPIAKELDYETSFQDWLAQLAEEKDVAKLSEMAEEIENTIKSLGQTNTP